MARDLYSCNCHSHFINKVSLKRNMYEVWQFYMQEISRYKFASMKQG